MRKITLTILVTIIIISLGRSQTLNVPDDIGTSTNAGNVGIGTTSPQSNLHINNSDVNANFPSLTSRGDILQLFEVINNTLEIGVAGASNTRRSWILSRHDDLSGTYGKYYSTLHLQPNIGDKSQFRGIAIGFTPATHIDIGTHLAVDGNVGIGTVSPNYQLHIKDGSGLRVQSSNAQIVFSDISNSLKLRMNNSGDLQLTNISDNSLCHFDNNGNVGIGTTNPIESKLVINHRSEPGLSGNKTGALAIIGLNTELAIGASSQTNGGSWIQTRHKDSQYPASAYTLALNPLGGNVGIGTSNTFGYKLAVNGTIGAKEVKVENTSAWPDYVFSDNYKLNDLNEIENFVKENKHLPDIPSAREVEENGIQLGEMDAKLLQKIEELTLYMIEQNKKTETLIEKVETLESENELLKGKIIKLETAE